MPLDCNHELSAGKISWQVSKPTLGSLAIPFSTWSRLLVHSIIKPPVAPHDCPLDFVLLLLPIKTLAKTNHVVAYSDLLPAPLQAFCCCCLLLKMKFTVAC